MSTSDADPEDTLTLADRSRRTDPTFRTYDPARAQAYATHRGSYTSRLFDHIFQYHEAQGNGSYGTALDVGCGPGNVSRDLAGNFDRVVGIDPGREMIARAREMGWSSKSGEGIQYEVAPAEDFEELPCLKGGEVDLITVGMALATHANSPASQAHWFDMHAFYTQAAAVLRSGGTLAIWTNSSLFCHPTLTPHARAVQRELSMLEDEVLGPYEMPGNRLSRNMYDDLVLPWHCVTSGPSGHTGPSSTTSCFSQESYTRLEWNRDGTLDPGEGDFFAESNEMTLGQLSQSLGTASMVTRWREANPSLAETEEDDCVYVCMRRVARAMRGDDEVDVEDAAGKADWRDVRIKVGSACVLLLFTKT